MKTTPWTIKGAFGIIGEIFDELSHADRAWKQEVQFVRMDNQIP